MCGVLCPPGKEPEGARKRGLSSLGQETQPAVQCHDISLHRSPPSTSDSRPTSSRHRSGRFWSARPAPRGTASHAQYQHDTHQARMA